MNNPAVTAVQGKAGKKTIKCVVWDLDNTLWSGVLQENDNVSLRENVVNVIETLDNRGILQSIASKNAVNPAMQKLREFGLQHYFLYPQINWNSKASSLKVIAQSFNIGLDTVAFIDDQPFEREEVSFSLPEVLCINAADLASVLDMPEMNPRFITKDSKMRRSMYVYDIARNQAEEEFVGPQESFLASLDMVLTIFPPEREDLNRAEELTIRTNQLNATGYTYSYDELNHFRQSNRYKLFMAHLEDKFGSYGHIGLVLVECQEEVWTIKLLLMSCRVMSRGVGSIMLNHIMNLAKGQNVRLQAEFLPSGRNRMMDITYRFSGFYEVARDGNLITLQNDLDNIQPYPDYVGINILDKTK